MKVPISKQIDLDTLTTQLSAALGVPLAVSARQPGGADGQGNPVSGVVILLDPATGESLPVQDKAKVDAVLGAHTPPPPAKSPAQALHDALTGDSSPAGLRNALTVFAGALVAQEQATRHRRRHR